MKQTFSSFLFFATLFVIVYISACTKICDAGYQGNHCDVEIRDKFEGVWKATDNPGNITYSDTIIESTSSNVLDVLILNTFATKTFNSAIKATIEGNTITIERQRPDTSKIELEGVGVFNSENNSITWTYSLINKSTNPSDSISYTGQWVK